MRMFLLAAFGLMLMSAPARACGVETDCMLGDRTYRIAMPEGHDTRPTGALIYAHGYRGSAKAAMRNKALIAFAHGQGMAFVATKSAGIDWMIPGVPANPAATGEVELSYHDAVIEDLVARHGIDRERLVATGFSAGGMMVWNLACHRGAAFRAFVPLAGTFWSPVPARCPAGPVNLVHVHGTADKIVPLTGRAIAETRQGNVFEALEMLGTGRGYGERRPAPGGVDLTCARRVAARGEVLALCTHPGGHSLKVAYLGAAFALLRQAGALPSPE